MLKTAFAELVPNGFVHVVSFIGCFCVSMVGFVLPPLFIIQLSSQSKQSSEMMDTVHIWDVAALVLGIITTVVTSVMTFHELMARAEIV